MDKGLFLLLFLSIASAFPDGRGLSEDGLEFEEGMDEDAVAAREDRSLNRQDKSLPLVPLIEDNLIEPSPSYQFEYKVADNEEQVYQQHAQNMENQVVTGEYSWVDPDGTLHLVKYRADETGYHVVETLNEPNFIKIVPRVRAPVKKLKKIKVQRPEVSSSTADIAEVGRSSSSSSNRVLKKVKVRGPAPYARLRSGKRFKVKKVSAQELNERRQKKLTQSTNAQVKSGSDALKILLKSANSLAKTTNLVPVKATATPLVKFSPTPLLKVSPTPTVAPLARISPSPSPVSSLITNQATPLKLFPDLSPFSKQSAIPTPAPALTFSPLPRNSPQVVRLSPTPFVSKPSPSPALTFFKNPTLAPGTVAPKQNFILSPTPTPLQLNSNPSIAPLALPAPASPLAVPAPPTPLAVPVPADPLSVPAPAAPLAVPAPAVPQTVPVLNAPLAVPAPAAPQAVPVPAAPVPASGLVVPPPRQVTLAPILRSTPLPSLSISSDGTITSNTNLIGQKSFFTPNLSTPSPAVVSPLPASPVPNTVSPRLVSQAPVPLQSSPLRLLVSSQPSSSQVVSLSNQPLQPLVSIASSPLVTPQQPVISSVASSAAPTVVTFQAASPRSPNQPAGQVFQVSPSQELTEKAFGKSGVTAVKFNSPSHKYEY